MNWEAIGALSELVGAAVVVVSVVYLAIQVRQNTISVRSATVHAISESFADFTAKLSDDSELLELYIRGLAEDPQLSTLERLRFDFLILTLLRKLEYAFKEHEAGAIRETEWRGWSVPLRLVFSSPGGRRWWSDWAPVISEEFQQHVAGMLGSHDALKVSDTHPVVQAVRSFTTDSDAPSS